MNVKKSIIKLLGNFMGKTGNKKFVILLNFMANSVKETGKKKRNRPTNS